MAAVKLSSLPSPFEKTAWYESGEPVDASGWLTRNQVADLTGISGPTLLSLERAGKLRPALGYFGNTHRLVKVYDPDQIARLPARMRRPIVNEPGELAARVFELFDQGWPVRRIVVETRQTPERIEQLHIAWLDGGGSALVIYPDAQRALEDLFGAFASVAELVTKARIALGRVEITLDRGVVLAGSDREIEEAILRALAREEEASRG